MPARAAEKKIKGSKASVGKKPAGRAAYAAIPKYKSGQHTMKSGYCIAMNRDGTNCMHKQSDAFVPYCKECMKNGDPSMAVEKHPKFGLCLVAKRELPKNYYTALWGEVQTNKEMPEVDTEWGFETCDGDFINPRASNKEGYCSQIQYCQCPGPNERVTITFGQPHSWMEDLSQCKDKSQKKHKYGSFIFVTACDVPKNHQLMMMYAEDAKSTDKFFEERGIVRSDIGFKARPALLRKRASGEAKGAKKTVKKNKLKRKSA